ncbi:MAG: FAD:protein FMN transferase [Bryobacteraceae bacterium]
MRVAVLILWLATLPTAWPAPPLRIESTVDAMGSTFSVVAYGDDRNRLQAAVDIAFEEVRRLDNLLSNYKPRSEWSKVNREAASHPVRVTPELFALLDACLAYSRATEGAFDITVGPLVRTWGFYKGTGRLPHRAEIRAALLRVGYQKVVLDRENSTVSFSREGVEIDPGGIGKGYAVDRIVDLLREQNIASALVSAGGSSIYGLGAPPGEDGWKVKIRHPRNPGTEPPVGDVTLRDSAMSTSGTSEKFFMSGGKMYSHIFDPRSGYPAPGMLSVTVLAARTIDTEAWTKPMFILGKQWAKRRKPRDRDGQPYRVFFCEDRTRIACAWLQ